MKAKLVIWDLDDTLWSGTLAENEDVVLNQTRAAFIRSLNTRGVVNSISSKNDFERAKSQLESFQLWNEFVFPEIAYLPKGELVKKIISDMQLRAPDVIFIDDNHLNLREVEFLNSGIQTLNAQDPETDKKLADWLISLEGIKKSRMEEYRQLERKKIDQTQSGTSNEEFLASCEIKVCRVRRSDNLPFARRIEELINRTNQMNFTKSRVPDCSMAEYVTNPRNETYSIFVWDKYGFYGLVGFSAVRDDKLQHLAYSCRIMNMGIEQAAANLLKKEFRGIKIPHQVYPTPWITFVNSDSQEFKDILNSEKEPDSPATVRVMANCQSGAIAHYMGQSGIEWDNWPRIFKLEEILNDAEKLLVRSSMIYGAFNDYDDRFWTTPPSNDIYRIAATKLTQKILSQNGKIFVILPPENFVQNRIRNGISPKRFKNFNDVWRTLAAENVGDVFTVEVSEFSDQDVSDPRHFTPDTLRKVSERLVGLVRRSQAVAEA